MLQHFKLDPWSHDYYFSMKPETIDAFGIVFGPVKELSVW